MPRIGPENAAEYVNVRPFAPLDDERPGKADRPKFTVEPFAAIRPVLEGSWLIKGLLPSHGLAVLYGPPGCGKSFVALDASLHVASGRTWAGRKVKPVGVIYVASEGGSGFKKRVEAARRQGEFPPNTPFGLITAAPNLGMAPGDTQVLIREIREQCAVLGFRPGLVVLDTLARSIVGADESSSRDMGIFIDNADAIGQDLDALVLPVHHTGKGQERGMRGSSALHGATHAEWEITSDDAGKSVKIAKMKDGEDGLSFMFRLRKVEVGEDEDGDPVTTCVTDILNMPEHAEGPQAAGARKPTGQAAEFLKAVEMAVAEMGEHVPTGSHVPLNAKGVRKQQLALYADKLGFTDGKSPEVRKATLNRHIRTLAGNRHLGQWGEWVWLAR